MDELLKLVVGLYPKEKQIAKTYNLHATIIDRIVELSNKYKRTYTEVVEIAINMLFEIVNKGNLPELYKLALLSLEDLESKIKEIENMEKDGSFKDVESAVKLNKFRKEADHLRKSIKELENKILNGGKI
jgi:Tfp pilus assembly ATPase PilU